MYFTQLGLTSFHTLGTYNLRGCHVTINKEVKRDNHVGTVTSPRDVHRVVVVASVGTSRPVEETQPGIHGALLSTEVKCLK